MTIIFDFDGTLHNTKRLYGCAFRKAYAMLVREGYAPEHNYSDEEVSCWLGVNAPDMWNSFMPDLPLEMKHKAGSMIGSEMIEGILGGNAVLFDGITEMLDILKNRGYRLLVLSNCRHSYMEAHRKALGLDKWFEGYFCAEDYGFIPKEEIFKDLAKKFPDTVYVMTGDRASDIEVGIRNNILTIGCLYGFASENELKNASVTVNAPSEIPQAVYELTKMNI